MSEFISLSQASKRVGKSKSTLHSYIKNGKLLARLNTNGVYEIDEEDLINLFGKNEQENKESSRNSFGERAFELAIYKEKLEATTTLLKSVESERDYLREQLTSASDERRMLSNRLLLLENRPSEHKEQEVERTLTPVKTKLWGLISFLTSLLGYAIYELYKQNGGLTP